MYDLIQSQTSCQLNDIPTELEHEIGVEPMVSVLQTDSLPFADSCLNFLLFLLLLLGLDLFEDPALDLLLKLV